MKKTNLTSNESGIAHLAFILLFVAVIGIVGVVGYRVYETNNESGAQATLLSGDGTSTDDQEDNDSEIEPPADDSDESVDTEAVAPQDDAVN